MVDKLAEVQHEIWAHWMKYLFDVSTTNKDGSVTIPSDMVRRWKRQISTQYSDLSRMEQESDIEQAQKVLSVIHNETDVGNTDKSPR